VAELIPTGLEDAESVGGIERSVAVQDAIAFPGADNDVALNRRAEVNSSLLK
jgi:hypothetical protein